MLANLIRNPKKILTEQDEMYLFKEYVKSVETNNHFQINHIQSILVKANQGLVYSVARKYVGRKLELEDLIQEGNMGLLKAINKFEISKGNRFSTYAVYWIQQFIEQALQYEADTIRIPVYMQKNLARIRKSEAKLTKILSRVPSIEEIALDLDLSVDKVKEFLSYSYDTTSLDSLVTEKAPLIDFVASKAINPEQAYISNFNTNKLLNAVSKLPYNEQLVITYRFGLYGHKMLSLEKIGRMLNVSHEQIRQLEKKAIINLRSKVGDYGFCSSF